MEEDNSGLWEVSNANISENEKKNLRAVKLSKKKIIKVMRKGLTLDGAKCSFWNNSSQNLVSVMHQRFLGIS